MWSIYFNYVACFLVIYRVRKFAIYWLLHSYQLKPQAYYWYYPWIEGISFFGGHALGVHPIFPVFSSMAVMVFLYLLLLLILMDIEYFLLPDLLVGLLYITGCIINIYGGLYTTPSLGVVASLLAYSSLRFFSDMYWFFTGRIGLGRGDVKLFGALGVCFGSGALPFILLVASCSGCIYGCLLWLIKKQAYTQPIPFGPFLALGALSYLVIH